MSRLHRIRLSVALGLLGCAAVLGYQIRHAGAFDIPTPSTLFYTGSLQTFSAPDNGTHNIVVNLYIQGSTTTPACTSGTVAVTCVDGQFTIPLPALCVTVIHANPNILAQVTIDTTVLGMTAVSAVPYAVEADTASNAAVGIRSRQPNRGALDGEPGQCFVEPREELRRHSRGRIHLGERHLLAQGHGGDGGVPSLL